MSTNLTGLSLHRASDRFSNRYAPQFARRVKAFARDFEIVLRNFKRLGKHVDAMQNLNDGFGSYLAKQMDKLDILENDINEDVAIDYDFDLLGLITNVAGNSRLLANEMNQTFKALQIYHLTDLYHYPIKIYQDIPGIGEAKILKFINYLAYKVTDMHKDDLQDLIKSPLAKSIVVTKPARRKWNSFERASKTLIENIKHYSDFQADESVPKAA